MTEAFGAEAGLISYSQFKATIASADHPFVGIFSFFDGLQANEGRLRHDRLICANLVLLTTLNRFGYDFQQTGEDEARLVLEGIENQAVVRNLATLVRRMQLGGDREFSRLLNLIDEFVELPVDASPPTRE